MNTATFFANKDCPFYPCHQMEEGKELNCMFCFCPMYHLEKCLGNPTYLKNGYKDCSQCTYPHHKGNYQNVINLLIDQANCCS